jgi:RNA polymerase sigma-70 factor (ECF subfamily)
MTETFAVQDCLSRVRRGDLAAANSLILHLAPLVQRLVRNHLPRRESEEDLMQDVFLKLLQKLDSYQERAGIPFEHWVSRLTVRTCLDALRAEKARPEWRFSDLNAGEAEWLDFLMKGQSTAPTRHSLEAKSVVTRLLAQLSPPDRLVLTFLDLEERSTQEIAQITGWTRPMVKMRAMRARHKLRQIAKELMKEDLTDS